MSYCGPTPHPPLHRPAIFASYFHPHRGEIPFLLYRERREDPHPVRARARIGILDGIAIEANQRAAREGRASGHPDIDRRVLELARITVARIDENPALVQIGLDNHVHASVAVMAPGGYRRQASRPKKLRGI